MNVTKQNHDDVSALLTVTIDNADYKTKVEKQLHNYAKSANIPGFRKGKVPMSMVKKQYEAPIAYEEINKLVSESLNGFINENKLRLVGQPVPIPVDDFDYKKEQLSVGFEVGFEPEFTIDLAKYKAKFYKVEASDKEVSQSIENMQKRFAEQIPQDKIGKDSHINVEIKQVVEAEAEGEHIHQPKNVTINAEHKDAFKMLKSMKMDETLRVSKADLLANEDLAKAFSFSKPELEQLHHDEVELTVKDFYGTKNHALDQDLFDKVYGKDEIKTEEELKTKVKTELDEYFQQNADVHFVNQVLAELNEKEEIQLPDAFLIKWLMFNNENIKTEDQAKEVFQAEKNQLKFQIIEGKLMNDNDVKIDYADILSQAEQAIRNQMAMYGLHHIADEEVQKYAAEMLKSEDQVKQISQEVAMNKLKDVILEKATKEEVVISHDEFLEIIKAENEKNEAVAAENA
ncbi:trigger factor [Frigoriflavimonas asaccharolytica]|uniref:Trigger factor n=1 Tax=Frigoriflavimonas asaccharolytica TaxID=2735899 RepID=A0A8J8K479_9FLAO|nr:trigger factor [Frigoriflavimonas asaccharolytica]NRS91410.1 trigger factor [Frigoriflavimonas asaccharolytica]